MKQFIIMIMAILLLGIGLMGISLSAMAIANSTASPPKPPTAAEFCKFVNSIGQSLMVKKIEGIPLRILLSTILNNSADKGDAIMILVINMISNAYNTEYTGASKEQQIIDFGIRMENLCLSNSK